MLKDDQIRRILKRSDELESLMSMGTNGDFAILSKEYAELVPKTKIALELLRAREELADLDALINDEHIDAEMKELIENELEVVRGKIPSLEHSMQLALLPKDEADDRSAILEIRAGTGGDEAALFAAVLMRMYENYTNLMGWGFELISLTDTDLGGVKELVASVSGKGVFARLKYESGVHRVQRVPETESGGRIHTSAATVAVLPEPEEIDIELDDKDLRIDTYRSQGAGGQHVNTTDSAVRVTHLPSGIVVQQQDEKSQHKNRAKAMKVLRARLYDFERARASEERAESRREQVGTGDRSERIRTYNFPQGRVTDHRINMTMYKLDKMITGEAVNDILDALITYDQSQRLTAIAKNDRSY